MGKVARIIYDSSESNSDLYYACSFLVPDPVLYMEIGDRADAPNYLVLNELEYTRGKSQARVHQVLSWDEYKERTKAKGKSSKYQPSVSRIIFEVLRDFDIATVVVPRNFPVYIADSLRKYRIHVVSISKPFFLQREIKTEEEIDAISNTQKLNEMGMDYLIKILKQSSICDNILFYENEILTSEKMHYEFESFMLRQNCSVESTIAACGEQTAQPHNLGSGPLMAHQPIILDIFPRHKKSRYWGDMTRTVVKGKASPEIKKMWQAVAAVQQKTIDQMCHSADSSQLHQQIVDFFADKGFAKKKINGHFAGFIHGTGHGVGLDIHEAPRFSVQGPVFKKNHVVTVEPGLYYPGIGGVRIEDIVVIRDKYAQNLNKYPKFLEIE